MLSSKRKHSSTRQFFPEMYGPVGRGIKVQSICEQSHCTSSPLIPHFEAWCPASQANNTSLSSCKIAQLVGTSFLSSRFVAHCCRPNPASSLSLPSDSSAQALSFCTTGHKKDKYFPANKLCTFFRDCTLTLLIFPANFLPRTAEC